MILIAGALDLGANVRYVLAMRYGLLAVVAVLTALYPQRGSVTFARLSAPLD